MFGGAAAVSYANPFCGRSQNGESGFALIFFTDIVAICTQVIGDLGGFSICLEETYCVVGGKVYALGGGAPLLGCLLGIWLLKEQALLLIKETENVFEVLFACDCATGS